MKLTTRSLALSFACLGLSAILIAPAFAQGDSQVGVWKLNVAKSKYSPGPAPASATTTIVADGAGTKVSVDQTQADGTARKWGFTGSYDGKDSPMTGHLGDHDPDRVYFEALNEPGIRTATPPPAASMPRGCDPGRAPPHHTVIATCTCWERRSSSLNCCSTTPT